MFTPKAAFIVIAMICMIVVANYFWKGVAKAFNRWAQKVLDKSVAYATEALKRETHLRVEQIAHVPAYSRIDDTGNERENYPTTDVWYATCSFKTTIGRVGYSASDIIVSITEEEGNRLWGAYQATIENPHFGGIDESRKVDPRIAKTFF